MNWHTVSLPLIVIGVILYHVSQKTIPRDANPLIALAAAYLIAFSLCIVSLVLSGDIRKGSELFRNQNWVPVILLGLTAICIELGYLYAYRTGWKLSSTSITVGAFTTGAVALVGVFWFKEELTSLHAVGILLCIAGVVCINIR